VSCEECSEPNIIEPLGPSKINPAENITFSNSRCTRCPAGKRDANDRTSCVPCTGNGVSTSGRCEDCEEGQIAKPDHTACIPCPERETFINGVSNVTSKCGCGTKGGTSNNGYYDAENTLIVCFHDGFKQDAIDTTVNELANNAQGQRYRCQECPSCVDCFHGVPYLRDGYTLGEAMTMQVGEDQSLHLTGKPKGLKTTEDGTTWSVHFVFFCDEDTAVTPTTMATFNYFTTTMAMDATLATSAQSMHRLQCNFK
jgi:hypothetical protein